MQILVTGFDAFDHEKTNPAFEAVKRLDDMIEGHKIFKVEIPTVFGDSTAVLMEQIKAIGPDIVICVGQYGGSPQILIERVAINIDDARIPDNKGCRPVDRTIIADGKNAYFSNLPIKKIIKNMQSCNIPVRISNSAGTFVCNHILYNLLHSIDSRYCRMLGGFIHVPYLPEQVIDKKNMPSMSLEIIIEAIKIAIRTTIDELMKKGSRE